MSSRSRDSLVKRVVQKTVVKPVVASPDGHVNLKRCRVSQVIVFEKRVVLEEWVGRTAVV